eukprot:756506-Hanusia_phi.AAC.5
MSSSLLSRGLLASTLSAGLVCRVLLRGVRRKCESCRSVTGAMNFASPCIEMLVCETGIEQEMNEGRQGQGDKEKRRTKQDGIYRSLGIEEKVKTGDDSGCLISQQDLAIVSGKQSQRNADT